jgi:hypothetical protein
VPASSPTGPFHWFSNGTTNGGSFRYGVYSNPQNAQLPVHKVEHVLLADSNVRSGQSVACYAPIRPAAAPAPSFLSWFGISTSLAPSPIPLPGISGLLLIEQSGLVAPLFGLIPHDACTGLGEWTFPPYSPTWPPTTYPMQMITLELTNLRLTLSNVADFTF